MNPKKALIITSIAAPNDALKKYASECSMRNIQFIVVGDASSPPEFHLEGCEFYSLKEQKELPFSLSKILPEKKYSRKNIGYLIAIADQNEIISETDDDNFPRSGFWKPSTMDSSTYYIENKGWLNVYAYFTEKKIWPRAFPLEQVNNEIPSLDEFKYQSVSCPVQQGLADENPDVDAIFRLVKALPIYFKSAPSIALGYKTWCPFNSQNTRWFKDAFPLLYLPTYCSFRMTDIWRSFIAQRIFWENNWSLLFHKATVFQKRNDHNILRDFYEEIDGYLNNHLIIEALEKLELKKGVQHLNSNLKKCYEVIIKMGLIDKKEMDLIDAWCNDIEALNKPASKTNLSEILSEEETNSLFDKRRETFSTPASAENELFVSNQ